MVIPPTSSAPALDYILMVKFLIPQLFQYVAYNGKNTLLSLIHRPLLYN